jgi:hypothetical protein
MAMHRFTRLAATVGLVFALPMAGAIVTQSSCHPLPASTGQDVGKDLACVATDYLGGTRDPSVIAHDCRIASAQVVEDLIAVLFGFADRVYAIVYALDGGVYVHSPDGGLLFYRVPSDAGPG